MVDLRPVVYVIGLLTMALGLAMLVPMGVDLRAGNGHAGVFFQCALITLLFGGVISLASANGVTGLLTLQQTFLLTSAVWLVLPFFGALPFVVGYTEARLVDATFEAMSGMTTTGSTVFSQLSDLPAGLLLWRGMLQWFGGVGVVIVAMVFLPELRVGGMQVFKTEGFDTFGKILPRATEIARRIAVIYVVLTLACAMTYILLDMPPFDALVHAMTTVSTGGFANTDGSMGVYGGAVEYAAVLFMVLAALPFVRYVQMIDGDLVATLRDPQTHGFAVALGSVVAGVVIYLWLTGVLVGEEALRKALFNLTSIMTGTGYASTDYGQWGAFAVGLFFFVGLIGGCAGSTSCSVKIFRYQILISSIRAQIQRIHSPHGVFQPRFMGRTVTDDILSSVTAFFVLFMVTLMLLSVLLAGTGLDFLTAVSGAATALGNIGPGLGEHIGPSGNFGGLNDAAKWLLIVGMFVGRLELMAVYVLFTAAFWRG